jgi:hypothetical protein
VNMNALIEALKHKQAAGPPARPAPFAGEEGSLDSDRLQVTDTKGDELPTPIPNDLPLCGECALPPNSLRL